MRKQIPALLAAFVMTGMIALTMGVVGVNALYNPNSSTASNVPAAAVANVSSSGSTDQVAQLQSLVVQYQQRELQYQQQLQTDQQQLQQANDQIQQFQQLLAALQERGILSIDRNGQVTIHLRRGDD